MIDTLSPELLQAVLGLLPKGSLQQARLACKALDAASRRLAAYDTLTLTPDNAEDEPPPDLRRLPVIACVVIDESIRSACDPDWLHDIFSGLQQLPARVTRLQLCELGGASNKDLKLCLEHAPGVTHLHVMQADWSGSLLEAAAGAAPQLEAADSDRANVNAAAAAALAALPRLRGLAVHTVKRGALAALPLRQLTSLVAQQIEEPLLDALAKHGAAGSLTHLVRLGGVTLLPAEAAALSRALPRLERLHFWPSGEWGALAAAEAEAAAAGGEAARFPHVTHAACYGFDEAFCATDLSGVFPALEHLYFCSNKCDLTPPVGRLTHLKSIVYGGRAELDCVADWDMLRTLPHLSGLAFTYTSVCRKQLPRFAALRHVEIDFLPGNAWYEVGSAPSFAALLRAANAAPCIESLALTCSRVCADDRDFRPPLDLDALGVLALARGTRCRLRTLVMGEGLGFSLADAVLLCMWQPALQHLAACIDSMVPSQLLIEGVTVETFTSHTSQERVQALQAWLRE